MDEINIDDDGVCPHCSHSPILWRYCAEFGCDDGYYDESEEDYCVPGTILVECRECRGTGIERWCPECGENLSGLDCFDVEEDELDDEEYDN